MRVYLKYPWKFPDSPYYKYLADNPPKRIEYLNIKKQKGVIINKKKFLLSNNLKKIVRNSFNLFGFSLPNVHLTKTSLNYDLIHCAHCLSKNKFIPWVADFEGVWQMFIGKKNKNSVKKIRKILLKDNCKKIIAWTEKSKNEISNLFPEIKEKIEKIYPAVPIQKFRKERHKTINILFVGRYFYAKGGLSSLRVMDKISKKYENVRCTIISDIPKEIKDRYKKNINLRFYRIIPQERLFEIYKNSDIMIYPGYSDSFGFILLEAMSYGIPIITVDGTARKEIVEEKTTGFVIKRPDIKWKNQIPHIKNEEILIESIYKKVEKLIKDRKLRETMSKNCMEKIESGKFSIKRRNKQLQKIYGESLKWMK